MSRISFDDSIIQQLEVIKQRSTCPRLHTAAIIASTDNRILCSGYNGSLPKQPHCDDVKYCSHCIRGIRVSGDSAPTCSYCKGHYAIHTGCLIIDGHCKRTVHAEANAILQAAKFGTPIAGSKMYSLHTPCIDCAKMIISVGISELLVVHGYRASEILDAREMLENSSVTWEFLDD